MLLNFRVSNYRSFRDEVSISLLATRLDTGVGVPTPLSVDKKPVDVLTVAAVMGANASGKSNLLRALERMREIVVSPHLARPSSVVDRDPFLLDKSALLDPTMFEIEFELESVRYQYGFELGEEGIVGEWLNTFPYRRAQTLFDRERGDYTFGKKLGGQTKIMSEMVRDNALFLTVAAQANHPTLTGIYHWFENSLSFLDVPSRGEMSASMLSRIQKKRHRAVELMAMADLGIVDAQVEVSVSEDREMERVIRAAFDERVAPDMPPELRELEFQRMYRHFIESEELKLVHRGLSGPVALPFEEESLGTKSWMAFIAYALDALESGGTLFVDELDASLHPLLMSRAVEFFQDKRLNAKRAQLVFTTHDTNILAGTGGILRLSRGQVWFAEKDDDGVSRIVPLSDFRPRKGENLERGYLEGRYGGTPRLRRSTLTDKELKQVLTVDPHHAEAQAE